ncbi:MAG: L-2-amino-thiazoline-4-carboxylic acid hydrolase [Atopobiaceae bacterium]|nr:L-2-amino-thiazoline-4-carboxylic acid hydrolase [Atopobiaceae bacterium]
MGRSSKELLKGRKYDTLLAQLVDRLGTDGAAALWVRAERRLDGMLTQSKRLPKGERPQVEGFVLPTCALYFELTDAFGKDEAFRMVDDYMAEYSANASKAFRLIVALPGGRGFFMRAFGKVVGLAFGEKQGYVNAMHECTPDRIAYDVLTCPYHRTFAQMGAPELCQLFCRNDEICYGDLDGIRFVRKGTLAKGASHCDFLIERK